MLLAGLAVAEAAAVEPDHDRAGCACAPAGLLRVDIEDEAVLVALALDVLGRCEGFGHRSLHQRRIGGSACAGAELDRRLAVVCGGGFALPCVGLLRRLEAQRADRRLGVAHAAEFDDAVDGYAAQLAERG